MDGSVPKFNLKEYAAAVMALPKIADEASRRGIKKAEGTIAFTSAVSTFIIVFSYFSGGLFYEKLYATLLALVLCWFIPSMMLIFLRTFLSIYTILVSIMIVLCIIVLPIMSDIESNDVKESGD